MTGAAFVLAITEYAKEHGIPNGAPVSIVAPSAAIYSVIGSLLDSVLTSDYEMPIDVDKEQVRIQNFLANNYYNAEEIYYAVRGAIGMLTAELQAIGGDDATAIVNLISTFIDGVDGFRTEVFFTEKRRVYGSNLTAQRLKNNINAYAETLQKALEAFYRHPDKIKQMTQNAMRMDFSWNVPGGSVYKYFNLLKTGHL